MDLATLIGLIGGLAFIAMAMVLGGSITMYVDVPSIFIVFVGSLFVVMMKFNLGQFLGAAKVAGKAFMFKLEKPEDLIERVVQLADAARKGGFLALEEAEITNPFLQKAVNMLVDGHDQAVVKAALEKDIDLNSERQEQGAKIFRALGDVAPAMGMIGTLIGLVAMLANMDDPKAIGPAMAIALLTTLYGAMLANMIALPIADKLDLRSEEERLNRTLIMDAVLGIQDGQNPRVLQGLLENYLAENKRTKEE
ncbi:flagellar motor protein PomA [Oceanimonas baumannii]|uniref:Chemotaxis protein MotA n=1 Tax=Oceanimonas baumannii TaxID=129578 RepID=A0A235CPR0_9GAMM|nr:flagellar motor protein PomA [Oceanimonas baumannii]OYD26364.1 flagellar motor protein PomA [Oceanimonas baumannii]TDW61975.1 chemotaxis protein MotA [Oceanimonas baumannii]